MSEDFTGQEFKALRKRTGLTLEQMAGVIGLRQACQAHHRESGRTRLSGAEAILARQIMSLNGISWQQLAADVRKSSP